MPRKRPGRPLDGSAGVEISDVAVDGSKLTFKRGATMAGPDGAPAPFELTYTLTAAGDAFADEVSSAFDPSPIKGARKK